MSALRPDTPQHRMLPLAAAVAGIITTSLVSHGAVKDSIWAAQLGESIAALRGTDDGDLPTLFDEYLSEFGDTVIPFGAWHGDFGPWNLAYTSSVPMIWDWERYADNVPAGMDVVHYQGHRTMRRLGNFDAARSTLEHSAVVALAQVLAQTPGVNTPSPFVLKAIVIGYLLTTATRFTLDGRTVAGEPIRDLARWHRLVIADQLQRGPRTATATKAERS